MRLTVLRRFAISCLMAVLAVAAAARTRPHYGGTLRVEIEGDAWGPHSELARRLVFDGLTRIDAAGVTQPALAVRWTSENTDHRWEFWLRPGVRFQDGAALTSAAIETSLAGSCGANCPWAAVHALGTEVIFTSDTPMPNLPALLAGDEFLIARSGTINSSGTTVQGATPLTGLVIGTGPFAPDQFSNGMLSLAANDTCWQGRPFADRVEIRGHRTVRDQWLDLSVGHADLVEVPAEQLRQARDQHLIVVASPPISLLALAVANSGVLYNPNLRASIAQAVDRSALSNVIFQKQGEITAGLLPAELTGYGFLFPVDRDINKARELRGGLNTPQLTLSTVNNAAMQLAAQRLALNLHEAGFNVQVAGTSNSPHSDMVLLRLTLRSSQQQSALESLLRNVGVATQVLEETPAGLYRTEHDFLETHTLIPLLYLPRAYAAGGRVRDLRLSPDGVPLLAGVSLEDTP